jgi:hypothetical protein
MTIDPQSATLAKDFEPILLFHPSETVFPIDPKFYLERCALWRNTPPSDKKTDWGEPPSGFPRKPLLAKGQIAALKDEATDGKTWIGATAAIPTTERPSPDDWFLQLIGWNPFGGPGEVTAASNNRHPTLNASFYKDALQGGRSWYYCEHLTHDLLLAQFSIVTSTGLDLSKVINNDQLGSPSALIYHFFYPLHEEPLRGCELAGDGQTFATFAGEWTAIAILLDSRNEPLFIGLTSRNVGDPAASLQSKETRIGMTVHKWSDVNRIGKHPKIFVSRGTHGNYLEIGPHAAMPFTPGDIDLHQGTCAQIETLDDVVPGGEAYSTPSELTPVGIMIVKGILTALTLGVASAWIADEISSAHFGASYPAIEPNRTPQDETGGPLFGLILRPAGSSVPEQTAAQNTEDWATTMPNATDKPRYDFIVDRDAQLWWPPRGASVGYAGRWGPRVTNDPKNRRSGMRCPDFALRFLEGIARLPLGFKF